MSGSTSRWSCGARWSRTTGSTSAAGRPASSSGRPTRRSTSSGCRSPIADGHGRPVRAHLRRHRRLPRPARQGARPGRQPAHPGRPRRRPGARRGSRRRSSARTTGRCPIWFDPVFVREMVDATIGIDHLEGWVEQKLVDGRRQRIRAFGSRAVHIVAGNSPVLSGVSVIRNAVTRSDAIIKTPSNDPLTAVAIARTMVRDGPGPPAHEAPRGRVLEGRRRRRRGAALPARARREDRGVGRLRLGDAT